MLIVRCRVPQLDSQPSPPQLRFQRLPRWFGKRPRFVSEFFELTFAHPRVDLSQASPLFFRVDRCHVGRNIRDIHGSAQSPQALALDNDSPAPNMDIVSITIKLDTGSRRREGSADARSLTPTSYAELRAPMIFLIANMEYKIPANPLKTRDDIFSNREFRGVSHSSARVLESRKTEPFGLRDCVRISGSAKGEFALV
jgi:hypothetical protein